MTLFEQNEKINIAILLIDTSGSVFGDFMRDGPKIFTKMSTLIHDLPVNNFRFIFWNSEDCNTSLFKNGFVKFPHIVKNNKFSVEQLFTLVVNSNSRGCTHPYIGFENIDVHWIDNINPTHIYLITDGIIQSNTLITNNMVKERLANSIKNLFKNFNNIHLHIITVESKIINMNELESVNNIAGGDVFNVIRNNNMCDLITEFKSYTINNPDGYIHINRIVAPAGYIPFGNSYFSEGKINEFIIHITNLVHPNENKCSQDLLLRIIQDLSNSIKYIIKDKPTHIKGQIINMFCNIFKNTEIDFSLAQFIIRQAIDSDINGQINTFSEYRNNLKNLYQYAHNLLSDNTKIAINIKKNFITLPINYKIIVGSHNMITEKFNMFKNGAIKIGQHTIPVLPYIKSLNELSEINEQCMRQYIRSIISTYYHVGFQDDSVIFIVLGLMLSIIKSNVSNKIKNMFRIFAKIMLRKKRTNSITTELQRLQEGEFPLPNNGQINDLFNNLNLISILLKLNNVHQMTIWYCICLALEDKQLIQKQLIHCVHDIELDFPNYKDINILDNLQLNDIYNIINIPNELLYDYTCLITMEDISNSGGYKFKQHMSLTGSKCHPFNVLSNEGYEQLINNTPSLCPICYQNLNASHFEPIGIKPEENLNIFTDDDFPKKINYHKTEISSIKNMKNIIEKKQIQNPIQPNNNHSCNNTIMPDEEINILQNAFERYIDFSKMNDQLNNENIKNELDVLNIDISEKIRELIILRGSEGCGKNTFAILLKQCIEYLKGECFIIKNIQELLKIDELYEQETKIIIVILNINELQNNDIDINSLGFNANRWKRHVIMPNKPPKDSSGYTTWCFINILMRKGSSSSVSETKISLYNTTLEQCKNIIIKQSDGLFKKINFPSTLSLNNKDIEILASKYKKFYNNIKTGNSIHKIIKKLLHNIFSKL